MTYHPDRDADHSFEADVQVDSYEAGAARMDDPDERAAYTTRYRRAANPERDAAFAEWADVAEAMDAADDARRDANAEAIVRGVA